MIHVRKINLSLNYPVAVDPRHEARLVVRRHDAQVAFWPLLPGAVSQQRVAVAEVTLRPHDLHSFIGLPRLQSDLSAPRIVHDSLRAYLTAVPLGCLHGIWLAHLLRISPEPQRVGLSLLVLGWGCALGAVSGWQQFQQLLRARQEDESLQWLGALAERLTTASGAELRALRRQAPQLLGAIANRNLLVVGCVADLLRHSMPKD